jgi:hypothetical protein
MPTLARINSPTQAIMKGPRAPRRTRRYYVCVGSARCAASPQEKIAAAMITGDCLCREAPNKAVSCAANPSLYRSSGRRRRKRWLSTPLIASRRYATARSNESIPNGRRLFAITSRHQSSTWAPAELDSSAVRRHSPSRTPRPVRLSSLILRMASSCTAVRFRRRKIAFPQRMLPLVYCPSMGPATPSGGER